MHELSIYIEEKQMLSSKKIRFGLVIISLLSYLPLLVLAIYSRPCVDDYSYSIWTHDLISSGNWNILSLFKTAWEVDLYYYNNWQGLYTSAFVLSLCPSIFGEKYYFIGVIALILLEYASVYVFCKIVCKRWLQQERYIWIIALFAEAVLLQGMPSALQGLYWLNGAWNYVPFFFLTLINMAMLIEMGYSGKWRRVGYIILSGCLSFLISGGNHVTAFLNILLLIIVNFLYIKTKKVCALPALIGAIIGFGIMYFAPGTSVRQSALNKTGVPETLLRSVFACYTKMSEWMNLQWICMMLLVGIFIYLLIQKEKILFQKVVHPVWVLLSAFAILAGMFCVPIYAMGTWGEARLWNVIWLAFYLLSAFTWGYVLLWYQDIWYYPHKKNNVIGIGAIILCLICCFNANANVVEATREIVSGEAKDYADKCDQRYKQMTNGELSIIYAEELPDVKLLKFDDVKENENDWRNQVWFDYYGIKIRLIKN